tara:strand:- start:4364 stop:4543 length:180 start_codon:yes stop_codon:yes gene_type:complete
MEIGNEVLYFDGKDERIGIIENINEQTIHICMSDNSLFITNINCIIYNLTKPLHNHLSE